LVILDGKRQQGADIGLYWRYEKWMRRRLSRVGSVMGATGCIYAMRRDLAVPLPEDMLVDDMYLPLVAFLKGYRVLFDERAKAYDYPTALRLEFRRKARTLAGNYQIIRHLPGLLVPTNRMWLHFVSHKVGRLLLPFGLLAIAVATPWLPAPWRALAVASQGAVYGLAFVDRWVPEGSLLKRLSSPARTFLMLVVAALWASSIVLPGRHNFWRVPKTGGPAA
jgi:hypothetical protein